jgi:hypothetical protein
LVNDEAAVEAHLIYQVLKRGGLSRKLEYVNRRGAPDRLVALNGLHLVELKRKGGCLSPHQQFEHLELRKRGVPVACLWSIEEVDEWLEQVCA